MRTAKQIAEDAKLSIEKRGFAVPESVFRAVWYGALEAFKEAGYSQDREAEEWSRLTS